MMKNTISKSTTKLTAILLIVSLIVSIVPIFTYAENNNDDPFIVVSLGDSYSSGEGIEPFYGQNKAVTEKVKDQDWLAHRSEKSWPGRLVIPGVTENGKTLADYRADHGVVNRNIQWYFGAVSGAQTRHFGVETIDYTEDLKVDTIIAGRKQKKEYCKQYYHPLNGVNVAAGTEYMPKQLDYLKDIANNVQADIDYVTLTLGGNDVNFSEIIKTCAANSTYLNIGLYDDIEEQLKYLKSDKNIERVQKNLESVYRAIAEIAPTADIVVAGYPKLLNPKGFVISEKEANLVNDAVCTFNGVIAETISTLKEEIKIHFVEVETVFNTHEAYSSTQWINKVDFTPNAQDLGDSVVGSAYSMHPNDSGAAAYAECVNEKIAQIEAEKHKGTLAGKICKASDRVTPITDAKIEIVGNNLYKERYPDSDGNYAEQLIAGEYQVRVTADGYIDFNAYATVEKDLRTYMETFLLVEGEEGETGTVFGKITNAMTGYGVEGVKLDVRVGWNNADKGTILTTTTTNSTGDYNVTLPLGNYTLVASKNGFVSNTVNIVVQKDVESVKNGAITPIISGNKFRVVLTWGTDPSDLDSHVEGNLSNGEQFHVAYWQKSQYDGSIEVCNLDVDDTSSYGPETITLNTITESPYYYYIHRYSGYGSLATSNAQINLYQGEHLVATFNVPTDQAEGRYWNVFSIKNGELIVKNTITSSPDISY